MIPDRIQKLFRVSYSLITYTDKLDWILVIVVFGQEKLVDWLVVVLEKKKDRYRLTPLYNVLFFLCIFF